MRRWILWVGLMAAALLVAALAYGCGETSFGTCADNATCPREAGAPVDGTDISDDGPHPDAGPSSDGSAPHSDAADGGGDSGPGTCILDAEPKDEPCLLDPQYGVFVSTNGT